MRFREVDILRGIAMCLVIIGHFWHPKVVAWGIWSFHMPLFVMISGFLFKTPERDNIAGRSRKIIQTYLKPYLITIVITIMLLELEEIMKAIIKGTRFIAPMNLQDVLYTVFYGLGNDTIIKGVSGSEIHLFSVGVIWFLLALGMGELIFNISFYFHKEARWFFLSMFFVVAMCISQKMTLPLQITSGAVFALWLEAGFVFRQYWSKHKLQMFNGKFAFITTLIWIGAVCLEYIWNVPFNIDVLWPTLFGVGVLGALAGSYMIYWVGMWIKENAEKLASKLERVGTTTLWIMCVHSVGIICFTPFYSKLGLPNFVIMLMRFLITIVISYKLQWLCHYFRERKKV